MAYIKYSAISCLEKMFCELRENSDKISRIKAVFLKNYVIPTLEASKTDDVAEVKYGEWVDDGDCFHCSVCNRTYHLGSLQTIYDVRRCWNYCANCGAKMDGQM